MEESFIQNPTIRTIEKKEWADGTGVFYFEIYGISGQHEIHVRGDTYADAIARYKYAVAELDSPFIPSCR